VHAGAGGRVNEKRSDETSERETLCADAPHLAHARCRAAARDPCGAFTRALALTAVRRADRPLLPKWLEESERRGKLLAEAPYGRRSAEHISHPRRAHAKREREARNSACTSIQRC
jgi:hypothetical protein